MFGIKNSRARSQKDVHNLQCREYFNCSVIVKDSLDNVSNVVLEWGEVKVPLGNNVMAAEVSRSLQKLPIWLMTPCTKSKENDFLEWKQSFFYYDGKWIKLFLKHVNEAWFYGRNPHLALLIADAVTSLFSVDPVIALRAACEGEQLEVVNCGNCRNEFLRLRFPNCYQM